MALLTEVGSLIVGSEPPDPSLHAARSDSILPALDT
jgi:hypothetical protein